MNMINIHLYWSSFYISCGGDVIYNFLIFLSTGTCLIVFNTVIKLWQLIYSQRTQKLWNAIVITNSVDFSLKFTSHKIV